nr:reverse transcriptase domain-containing protein [Tanacetum cinerariifolium]
MTRYLEKVNALTSGFKAFSIKQVPRSENKKADALSKIASTSFAHLSKQVLVKELKEKSISTMEVLAVVEEEGDTWMTHIFMYLTDETLPAKIKKARAIRRKSIEEGIKSKVGCKKQELDRGAPSYAMEIGMPTLRTAEVDPVQNNKAFEINFDLLEERKEEAKIRDFVYRNNNASRTEDTWKLGPKWEGPYKVIEALGKRAYKLRDRGGKQLSRTWNIISSTLEKGIAYPSATFSVTPVRGLGIAKVPVGLVGLGIGEVGYGIRDTWVDPTETVPEIAPMTLREVNTKRVDLLMEDKIAHQETILIVEEEAYDVREAWAHSIGLSQAVHSELQTHHEQGEVKKLEIKFWNLKVKGNDVPIYTERFQELTLICTKFVANEIKKIEKYISGLPDNIYGSVKSSKPKTLDETIELANDFTDQKLCTYAERQTKKSKANDLSRNNHGHQQQTAKRQNVAKIYNMGSGTIGKFPREMAVLNVEP